MKNMIKSFKYIGILILLLIQSCGNEEIELLDATYHVTKITCVQNGKIDLTVTGGVPPYNFLWSDQSTSEDVENIMETGEYSVVITDSEGRAKIVSEINVIREPSKIEIDATIIASDFLENNGSIELSIDGGVPPYTIHWSNSSETKDIFDLAPGSYNVKVTDVNQCSNNSEFTIEEKAGLLIDDRDGNEYSIVKNGEQIWMYDPLRYDAGEETSYLRDDTSNSDKGRYYTWETSMNGETNSTQSPSEVKGICPEGWHLPSPSEWMDFEEFLTSEKNQNNFDIVQYIDPAYGTSHILIDFYVGVGWSEDGANTYISNDSSTYIISWNDGELIYASTIEYPNNQYWKRYKHLCHCIKNN
ncbi:FISUMP domain-containing protein [Reichenbachiella sp.]|uniref:FISUMP domain-containing protein n=1 Tax=Reichenbachiella sp. TaxID=2184521 RepID=UPI003BB1D3E5